MTRRPEADPVGAVSAAMDRIARGDYAVRLDPGGLDDGGAVLADAFNAMAEALATRAGLPDFHPRLYEFSVGQAPDAVFWIDRDARFYYVNEQACRSLGYTREELTALTLWDIDPVFPPARWEGEWEASRAAGGLAVHHVISQHRRKDGTFFPVEVSSKHVALGDHEFHVAYVRDITERTRAEEALQNHMRLLQESQRVARLGHYELDVRTGVWEGSEVLYDVFGIGPDHPRTVEGWLTLVHPDSREELKAYFRDQVLGPRLPFDREYRIVRPADQREVWVHGLGTLQCDGRGDVVRMLGTIQDIDARKRLEYQLLQAQRMDAVGQLAGGVAHDFNNMLSVILGNAELIRLRLPANDPMLEDIGEIERAAAHSRDITGQLLAFSRRQIIAPQTIELDRHIDKTVRTLSRIIGDGIALRFHPGSDGGLIRFDPTQIDQILVNLTLNARDAMPDGGTLSIETSLVHVDQTFCRGTPGSSPGEYILLAVNDTGRGMDQGTMAKIFEPFFSTKTMDQSSGLGLATVYGIVKQNGGFITVRSRPGQGSRFQVYLPCRAESAPTEALPAAAREPGSTEGFGHILLVEDDVLVRRMTGSMLRKLGYRVTPAETPTHALEICGLPDARIDLVLTDVAMPELTGPELRDHIAVLCPDLPVLFMSGYAADMIVQHGVLDEDINFLQKPFTVDALAEKVRAALASSPPRHRPPPLR